MSKNTSQANATALLEWLKWMGKYPLLIFFFISFHYLNAQIIGYKDSSIRVCKDSVVKVPIYGQPSTSISGIYGNKVSSYLLTDAGRKAEIAWLLKNGFNSYCGYGVSDYLSSNRSDVQKFVLELRRNGFKEVGFIYSSSSTVTSKLDAYQKSCTNDSMKFDFVVSEIEQYNTGERASFYTTIKSVSDWCIKNNVKRYCYQGWPNQADCDSIVKYTDKMYLHAYGVYSNYTYPGSWAQGYTKGRVSMLSASAIRYNKKYKIDIIYSAENPDLAKTQFGYKYYLSHNWNTVHTSFLTYYVARPNIEMGGYIMFVENQMKVIKP